MEAIKKHFMAGIIAVIMAAVFALCLAGCSSEPKLQDLTGEEAVTAFEELPEVKAFIDESNIYLKEVGSHVSTTPSVSDITAQADAQASLNSVCDGVIDLKEYPKACEKMYQALKDSAVDAKTAAEKMSSATVDFQSGMTSLATSKLSDATELINDSTDAIDDYDKERAKVLMS